ncbi:MAG: hypothetical protein RSB05_05865, partial [Clostridiales bacterium]
MKAVIVEIKDKFAAALTDNGCIVKISNKNYVIGQVINMNETKTAAKKITMRAAAIAAAVVLTLGLSSGLYAYFTPYSYVSMDVNPSIEYTLNIFGRTLSVNAVNDDGKEILQEVNLKDLNNKTIDEAIKLTLGEIEKAGYFNSDMQGGIVIATSGKNHDKAEELADTLGQIVRAQCKEHKINVKVETLVANQKMMEEAKALGVTPGKLRLVQELQEEYTGTEPFDAALWLTMPVSKIMAEAERLDDLEDATEDQKDALLDAAEDQKDAEKDAAEKVAETQEKAADKEKEAAQKAQDATEQAEDDKKEAAEKQNDANEQVNDATENNNDANEVEDVEVEEVEVAEPDNDVDTD